MRESRTGRFREQVGLAEVDPQWPLEQALFAAGCLSAGPQWDEGQFHDLFLLDGARRTQDFLVFVFPSPVEAEAAVTLTDVEFRAATLSEALQVLLQNPFGMASVLSGAPPLVVAGTWFQDYASGNTLFPCLGWEEEEGWRLSFVEDKGFRRMLFTTVAHGRLAR